MKKIKKLMLSFSIIGMVLILSIGGCKKELSSNSEKLNNADLLMSKETGPGKKKVLRKSPGLKIEIKGDTIKRISPTLKNIDKITSILNEEQSKKNQGGVMTTKSANFTASLAGTYYNCYAELNDPGPYDWYLINWYTGVYTYIGSSTDYINFNVQKPSMYGSYRVWGEGPYSAGFTGYQYMGDPYTGVSISSGVLMFSSQSVYDDLIVRLEDAYDAHSSNFYDQYDAFSDAYVYTQEVNQGFDDLLPYKEFEAHFGFSSLRAKVQTEIDTWAVNPDGTYPEDNYSINDESELALLNISGYVNINGSTINQLTAPGSIPGSSGCIMRADDSDWVTPNSGIPYIRAYLSIKGTTKARAKIVNWIVQAGSNSHTRYATKMKCRIYGTRFDNSCVAGTTYDSGFHSSLKRKKRRSIKTNIGGGYQFQHYYFTGEFYSQSSYLNTLSFN